MNVFLNQSIQYANQRSYLDDLFRVYPTIPEGIRDINMALWEQVEISFENRDNRALVENLLKMDLFPIKDSYIAYLKRDNTSISRNPATIDRIAGRIYELGLTDVYNRCTEPKETNRQIGPMFKNWIRTGVLGLEPVSVEKFLANSDNAILDASDAGMMEYAKRYLNYQHDKGLDFVARFNNKIVIGEAKFLTDFGGHQNAQLNDAISTITTEGVDAIKIAILDGVLYIPSKNKMHTLITETYKNYNIMSSLVLREFLYQL